MGLIGEIERIWNIYFYYLYTHIMLQTKKETTEVNLTNTHPIELSSFKTGFSYKHEMNLLTTCNSPVIFYSFFSHGQRRALQLVLNIKEF